MATTQFAQASYQEVIDLHTEGNTVSFMGIHTPVGDKPYNMLRGFFEQFRKYKYDGCRFSIVPAARLPADPLQVSYGAGDTTLDPRDLMNPLIGKGCHGNDMGTILNTMYGAMRSGIANGFKFDNSDSVNVVSVSQAIQDGDTTSAYEDLYYSALTDNTWLKAHPQAGFRKSGLRPMIYSVGSMLPLGVTHPGQGYGQNEEYVYGSEGEVRVDPANESTSGEEYVRSPYVPSTPYVNKVGSDVEFRTQYSSMPGFVTPRLQRLGWLDCQRYINSKPVGSYVVDYGLDEFNYGMNAVLGDYETSVNTLPRIFMYMIGLPPAYKHEQYYRMIIDHQFSFKNFRGASTSDTVRTENAYYDFN